jgi:hypothetical protein
MQIQPLDQTSKETTIPVPFMDGMTEGGNMISEDALEPATPKRHSIKRAVQTVR